MNIFSIKLKRDKLHTERMKTIITSSPSSSSREESSETSLASSCFLFQAIHPIVLFINTKISNELLQQYITKPESVWAAFGYHHFRIQKKIILIYIILLHGESIKFQVHDAKLSKGMEINIGLKYI